MNKPKILIVVGPTASGKTSLAVSIAKEFNGEVISADSRQVYRGLDIGSAKVTVPEMEGVKHHLIDIVDLSETYNAADFKRDAELAIKDILSRGKLPIICGGTFFYIDTLLNRVSLPKVEPNERLREELESKDTKSLLAILEKLDPVRAKTIDQKNKRRLIRAIEVASTLGFVPRPVSEDLPYDILVIGLTVDMTKHGDTLKKRIEDRLQIGMVEEVENLLKLGVTHAKLESLGLEYTYLSRYLRGDLSLETMISELAIKSRQFAKRQLTWLKRDSTIHWFNRDDKHIIDVVKAFLG